MLDSLGTAYHSMARSYAIYYGYLVLFMSALLTRNTVDGGSIITTFAGTGTTTSLVLSGDNGQATSAQLNKPYDVVLDSSGTQICNYYYI